MEKHRTFLYKRLLLITVLLWTCVWIYRYITGGLLSNISGASAFDLWLDRSFWIVFLSGIPQWVISNLLVCYSIDVLVLVLPFVFLYYSKRWILALFFLLLLIFNFTYEAYGFFHSKTSLAAMLAFIPFFSKKESFGLLFKGVRYYLVFVMVSAGFYKIINGAVFDVQYLNTILPNQHFQSINEGQVPAFIQFLISKPGLSYVFYLAGTLAEVFFIAALFTYKADKVLLLLLIIFSVFTFTVFRIENVTILMLGVSLLYSQYDK